MLSAINPAQVKALLAPEATPTALINQSNHRLRWRAMICRMNAAAARQLLYQPAISLIKPRAKNTLADEQPTSSRGAD